jgi:hypothetical protein
MGENQPKSGREIGAGKVDVANVLSERCAS